MTKKTILPQSQALLGITHFIKNDDTLLQYIRFRKQKTETDLEEIQLPLGKAFKGSILYQRDPSVKNGKYIQQIVRIYNKTRKVKSTSVLETRYSRVTVSKSRITVSLSFPLCDDAERLKARLQNFSNIIIDESDEIAAMLNQEGTARVTDAWQLLGNSRSPDGL